jgi:hypothetical protein
MAPVRFAINHLFGVRAAVFGLLVACAMASSLSAGRRPPDWVKGGKVDKYPAHVYVTGVGVGSDLDAARTNARAEVSKVFQARIRQTSQDILSEVSAAGSVQGRRESEMSTSVSTDGLLEGVRIAETWYDKKSKKHYALAVLNKAKARAGFSEQIADKEAESRSHLAQGQKAAEPLEKARHYARARAAWRDRDALITRRRVVDPANADFLANPASAEIDAALNEALHSIQFVVEAVSEDPAAGVSRGRFDAPGGVFLPGFRGALSLDAGTFRPGQPFVEILSMERLLPILGRARSRVDVGRSRGVGGAPVGGNRPRQGPHRGRTESGRRSAKADRALYF